MKIPLQLDEASLICPITGQSIQDPVVDHEGNSYEKAAILEWLSRNPSSPITRNPLSIRQLAPNRVLKALLEGQYIDKDEAAETTPPLSTSVSNFTVSSRIIPSDDRGHALIQVSVKDDESTSHKPASVVCVIDVSGSMDSAATMYGDSEGSGGLSLLDIVKHATRTVIETLSPQDRLAVISYSNSAKLVLPLTHMSPENKVRAWNAVDSLHPGGGTNLWSGLVEAMNVVNLDEEHCNIILLTDGQPNMHPPRGEIETLKRYKQNNPSMKASISTFGFGYCVESKLLSDICTEGKGHYCFIPDSSFVGTVFVNATANILSTAIPVSTLVVECNTSLEDLSGHTHTRNLSPPNLTYELPPLIYGQNIDILVKAPSGADKLHVEGIRIILKDDEGNELSVAKCESKVDKNALDLAKARAKVHSLISASEHKLSVEYTAKVFRLVQKEVLSVALPHTTNPSIKAIDDDLTGQIKEAYSRFEWHNKWGRHYLLSLARAYTLQQCTNFKDPGVQIYATKKFSLIRDASEAIFCQLPPPTPSRPLTESYVPVRSMSAYYSSATPCFARGEITLVDGRKVDISELRAGDEVESAAGPVRVKCIVKTLCENQREELVKLSGDVVVTPWHPVRKLGTSKWSFPADLAPSSKATKCDAVYSFVLENRDSGLKIGPYEGISMGHEIVSDPVAAHPYFGTKRVLDELAEMPGWSSGFITLGPKPFLRDQKTSLVVKLLRTSAIQ